MSTPFNVATGDPQAVKIWSKALQIAAIQKTFYSKFAGTSSNMPFQVYTDLSKGSGDRIYYDILAQMTGYGVNKNVALIDAVAGISTQESNVSFAQDSIMVEQKRLAHAWFRMASQRTHHDLLKAAMTNLSDRWATIMDRHAAAHLVGMLTELDTNGQAAVTDIGLHTEAVRVHDANHIENVGVTAAFTTAHLNRARWKAETMTIPNTIKPINVDGNTTMVALIRPEQAVSLQADSNWITAQSNAGDRGATNPLFSGMLGSWNGIAVHVWQYLPYATTAAPLRRFGILLGQQALAVAFGNAFDTLDQEKYGKDFVFAFVPREQTDYGQIKGMSAGCVFGMRRTMFNTDGTNRTAGMIRMDSVDAAIA
ncbi:MAG TPA: DUF4043 family protein [Polyangia bacterium]|nr:DUF4043 family protein [Polyangia bacterium]